MTPTWSDGISDRGAVSAGNLFLDDAWVDAFARHQPTGPLEPFALTMGQVRLPFGRARETMRGLPVRVMRVLGDPLADQCWFDPGAAWDWPAAVAALSRGPACDVVVLSELHAGEEERDAITRAARNAGLRPQWRLCGQAPVVYLKTAGGDLKFEDYSSTLRRRLKRSRKKLDEAGQVTVEHHLPTPSEVDPLLERIKSIEDRSWKGDEGTGIFSAARLPFMRDVSHRLAAKGALELYFLNLDGVSISYRYGFRHAGRFLDYNLAYLPDYHHLSPGRLLLEEIVKTSRQEGLEAVDASRGSLERPHILRDWPCEIREHYRLTLYRNTPKGRLLHLLETRVRPVVLSLRERFAKKTGDTTAGP